jgi:hypothetical protein
MHEVAAKRTSCVQNLSHTNFPLKGRKKRINLIRNIEKKEKDTRKKWRENKERKQLEML